MLFRRRETAVLCACDHFETAMTGWGKVTLGLAVTAVLLVIVLRGRAWLDDAILNRQAIAVARLCANGERATPDGLLLGQSESVSAQVTWLRASAAYCQGDEAAARDAWQQMLAASDARLPALRANAPQDVDLARAAAALYPENPIAQFWLGDALLQQGDAPGAIQAYEGGLAQDGTNANTWLVVGELYEGVGDWETAVSAYDQACYYVDRGKNGCPRAGRLYLAHDQYELAAQRFQDSLEQLPHWPPAQKGLAEALIALGKSDEAIPYLQRLAENGDAEARQTLNQLQGAEK
jgi:predicted Zn-dependent protease